MEQNDKIGPVVHNIRTINSATQSSQSLNGNKRGRPCHSKVISFCPQPKSIVSQLLNEIKSKRSDKEAANSAKVNDCLPNEYLHKSKETEIFHYDEQVTSQIEDFKTLNWNSSNECNDTKSWNMMLGKSKSYKSKRKNTKRKGCNNTGQLQDHLSTLEEVCFTCDYTECTYNTKVMSNLLKHKRVHTNERPYLCDQCTFRSNFVNSLKVHRRIHTTERPYCCERCGHRCNSISNLKKHHLHKHKYASEVVK